MKIEVSHIPLEELLPLRELYRQEMNCQIVHDSLPGRGFGNLFLIRADGRVAGYGFVMGYRGEPKDLIREFYVLPAYRGSALAMFRRLIEASQARRIEVQTNDVLLTLMLYDCATGITSDRIVFHDALTTNLQVPGVIFRRVTEADRNSIFEHKVEPGGDWLLEDEGAIVATGGIMLHYNPPYGDIYMEVAEPSRQRGYGSYLIQELKRTCYEMGRIPAARCDVANAASRAALQKAGLLPCARILTGVLDDRSSGGAAKEGTMSQKAVFKGVYPIGDTDTNALPVKAIGPAIGYYTQVLGFSLVDKDRESAVLVRDAVRIGLAVNGRDPEQASCYFDVSDVEALRLDLDAAGIEPGDIAVQEHEGKRYRVFFAKEPYGVCFCFGLPA
ncbi:MAG: GNAT family N-acetyltransferase [Isosphaeraceae bacterium]